jgi:DNA-binding transcriptional MerR regulator
MTQRSIGALADAAGVHIETVRYYERRGLLPEPPRTPAGYRVYDDDALWRLEFVARAKKLGFTLAEITDLLAAGEDRSVTDVVRAAREKLHEIDQHLTDLAGSQARLQQLVATCEAGDPIDCLRLQLP